VTIIENHCVFVFCLTARQLYLAYKLPRIVEAKQIRPVKNDLKQVIYIDENQRVAYIHTINTKNMQRVNT